MEDYPAPHSNPEEPVSATPGFVGRAGLVRNLVSRCGQRQSVLLYGGPKLGKTSLLLHVQWVLQQREAAPRQALYVDLSDGASRDHFLAGGYRNPAILLLDNCDQLIRHTGGKLLLKQGKGNGSPAQALIWGGGRPWRDFVRSGQAGLDLQAVPLAVLLTGEARALVGDVLMPDGIAMVLAFGGTHPYVLKVLRAAASACGAETDLTGVIRLGRGKLAPFFEACFQCVQGPVERQLLDYLIARGHAVNPREAAHALDLPTVKPAADTLCYLGLISRWNLNEGAMLEASCRLFNEWYLQKQARGAG
jgi:hypothetical protein